MKFIKSYKLFESTWTPEEFVQELVNGLGKWNLRPLEIRELIDRIDIKSAVESGQHPNVLINKIINELDLKSKGNSGFPGWRTPKNWQSEIKYL